MTSIINPYATPAAATADDRNIDLDELPAWFVFCMFGVFLIGAYFGIRGFFVLLFYATSLFGEQSQPMVALIAGSEGFVAGCLFAAVGSYGCRRKFVRAFLCFLGASALMVTLAMT